MSNKETKRTRMRMTRVRSKPIKKNKPMRMTFHRMVKENQSKKMVTTTKRMSPKMAMMSRKLQKKQLINQPKYFHNHKMQAHIKLQVKTSRHHNTEKAHNKWLEKVASSMRDE